jgi:ADP-ribose pyrophosphatase YjhB (NUDIX family)
LELGETIHQAVVREAKEETGLEVEPISLLGVYDRLVKDAEGRVLYHYVLVDFLCRSKGGILKASGDAAEAKWIEQEELIIFNLPEDTAAVIRQGIKKATDPANSTGNHP